MVRCVVAALLLLSPSSATIVSAALPDNRLDLQSLPSLPAVEPARVGAIAQDALENGLLAAEHSGNNRAVVLALLDLSRFNREQGRARLAVEYSRRALSASPRRQVRASSSRVRWRTRCEPVTGGRRGRRAHSYRRFKEESDRLSAEDKKKQLEAVEQKYQSERQASEKSGRAARPRFGRWRPIAGAFS